MASSFTALKIKEIHSGVIHKVGGRVKTWHKRWLILKSDYTLQYFKDPSKAPLGSISITDASFSIERGQDGGYTGWPKTCSLENTMIITTSGRIYYMYTDSLSETEEWIRVIEQQRQNIEKSTPQSLPGRYNKMGGKASSLEMPTVVEPTNRTPKQYRKKDRRLPTKRFNTASVTDSDEGSPIDSDTGADGQLDPNEFNNSCIDTSITSPTSPPPSAEPLYDLVTQANIQEDSDRPVTTSTNSLLPPRDVGNRSVSLNSVGENRNLKDSTCLNESLYDLVGRINAGEDEGGAPEPTKKEEETETQELYEPIADVPLDKGPPTPSRAKTSVPPPPPTTSQQCTEELYDSVDEVNIDSKDTGVMYEDVDRESGLKEAESSDDDDDERVPLPSSSLPQILSPPPPLPPRAGEEMYDNAPTLPPKQTDTSNKNDDDEPPDSEDYYGNSSNSNSAPLRIPVPSPLPSPSRPPKPLPRTIDPNTRYSANGTNGVTAAATGDIGAEEYGEELYDDIQGVLQSSSGSDVLREEEKEKREEEREIQREEIKREVEGETKREEKEEGRQKEEEEEEEEIIEVKGQENNKEKENGMNNDEDSEPANPIVKVSSTTNSPPTASKGKRVHAATVGSTDTGIEMFYRRAQELSTLGEDEEATKATKQAKDLFQTKKEAILSSEDKVVLAETLREVEAEKQLASEEKFKWERERLKFEEERKKFEREKQELLEELAKAKGETQ